MLVKLAKLLRIGQYLLGWYSVSISIVFTNKYILTKRRFHYPFTMAAANNVGVALITLLITRLPTFKPTPITWRAYITTIFPIGALTALDIGFSNWALYYLPISLHTIIRGTVPAFVLLAALLLGLESLSWLLCGAVLMVCSGITIASMDQEEVPPVHQPRLSPPPIKTIVLPPLPDPHYSLTFSGGGFG